jgi:predicted alpha/beta-fold hydrolase
MTEKLIRKHTDYRNAEDYFSRYTLTQGYLDRVPLPVTVITAEDDPVVPVEDFYALKVNDKVSLVIQPYGGHCGFISGLNLQTWLQDRLPFRSE